MEHTFTTGKNEYTIKASKKDGRLEVFDGNKTKKVDIISISDNSVHLKADGETVFAHIAENEGTYYINIDGVTFQIKDVDAEIDDIDYGSRSLANKGEEVTAPMPGKVIKILVKPGQSVKSGDKVAILEAMKMENELTSPKEGTIEKVLVKEGDLIEASEKIVEFKE